MRFYNRQHRHHCGIDLHVKTMYVCILDTTGQVLVHRNVKATPAAFLEVVAPYREDLVVAAECMFTWYWLADVCAAEGIAFVLGHALAMKAIHGGKAKNDKLDSFKIATLLAGPSFRPVSMPFEKLLRRSQHRLSIPDSNELLPHIAPGNLAVRQPMLEDELPLATIEDQPRVCTAATTPSKPEPPRTERFRMVGVFEDFAAKSAYHLRDRSHHLEVFDGVVLRDRHVLQAIRAACRSVSAGTRSPDAHPLR
jgi:hypothetical protein